MAEQNTNKSPTFWQGFGRFLRGAARLVLFALVVALVTAVIYFSVPYVYGYFVTPIQNNRALLDHLQRTQAQMQADLSGQLEEQRQRITRLEVDLSAEREARSELESSLAGQAAARDELGAQLASQSQAIAALENSMDAFDAALSDLDAAVVGVEQGLVSPEAEIARLQRRVLLLQMQQAILKARLHLFENNAGQAQRALEEGGAALEQLAPLVTAQERRALDDTRDQLEVVMAAILERPFIAVQELEILWELSQAISDGGR